MNFPRFPSYNHQLGYSGLPEPYAPFAGSNVNPMPRAYPPGQPSYPFRQPSYLHGQPSYPPGQPRYPFRQPSYPPGQHSYPPGQPRYPPGQPSHLHGQSNYPLEQPSYPSQMEKNTSSLGQYFSQMGQYPPQQPNYFLPQISPYTANPSLYLSSTMPGQYPSSTVSNQYSPLVSPCPIVQAPLTYSPQCPKRLPLQHAPSVYPSMSADGNGGSYPESTQATYPPISTPAHNQLLSNSSIKKKSNPTLRPANPFDSCDDANILRRAMDGYGTDAIAVIQILAHRINYQRQKISNKYKTMFGKDLLLDLQKDLSGEFKDLIVALMTPTFDFLAKEIKNSIDGIGTNKEPIVEILCTASNADIKNLKLAFYKLFGNNLEHELMGETSDSFHRLLVSLCQGNRSEKIVVDVNSAQVDAKNLAKAGNRVNTGDYTFYMILCSRSYSQLKQVFLEYQRLTGKDFEDVIQDEFSGDMENGLKNIVRSVKNKSDYFAKRLHESIGCGTNDQALIRIVRTRCEIDMADIKNAYMSIYGKSLEGDIKAGTSGDFYKCLSALVGG